MAYVKMEFKLGQYETFIAEGERTELDYYHIRWYKRVMERRGDKTSKGAKARQIAQAQGEESQDLRPEAAVPKGSVDLNVSLSQYANFKASGTTFDMNYLFDMWLRGVPDK